MRNIELDSRLLTKRSVFIDNNTKLYYYEVSSAALENKAIQFEKKTINGRELELCSVKNGLLLKGKYNFLLYSSIEDIKLVLENIQGQNYLTGLNPYNENIFKYESEIINKLCSNLSINPKLLDKSDSSLDIIDGSLEKEVIDDEFIEQNFLGIYLYVGEVIVKSGFGKWKLNYLEREKLWEPILLDNKSREISLGLPLLEYMQESDGRIVPGLLQAHYQRVLYTAKLP